MPTSEVTWAEVSTRAGRNDLPRLLVTHFWDLSVADRLTALERTWVMCEWPEQAIETDAWLMMFSAALDDDCLLVDGEEVRREDSGDLAAISGDTGMVTLYRGAITERKDGMSWTPDPAIAAWFARRFDGMTEQDAQVWTVTVPTDPVLAIFTGRSEHEVVLDISQFEEDDVQPYDGFISGGDVWMHGAKAAGLAEP